MSKLVIIGGGLAGSEAAWQASRRGVEVVLYEMRPRKTTPAHQSAYLGELVCSNSLGTDRLQNASGVLKEELRRLNSLVIRAADDNRLPAGGALAVDRERFAAQITAAIEAQPNITVCRKEVSEIPLDSPTIIASGPLTSDALAGKIKTLTGDDNLYFYDAIAPIVAADSINYHKVFRASRYNKGGGDYLNCPFTEEEYRLFWRELVNAYQHQGKEFEKKRFFEGCMPIEELARRGEKTPLFGPMKPVGLVDPDSGRQPFGAVQLRQENKDATMYNLVGFQTSLKRGEQKRIFRMIPGLEEAEFLRYGSLHRNTFINAPTVLTPTLQHRRHHNIFFAGQLTGVEGYVESTAMGLLSGIYAARLIRGEEIAPVPAGSAHGSLVNYLISAESKHFQPMNMNSGLFPPLIKRIKNKQERAQKYSEIALQALAAWPEAGSARRQD